MFRYQKTRLNNGLRITSAFLPQMESVTLGIWVRVGGRYETTKIAGISHFIEHLLFKGTRSRSALKIKETIEAAGGTLNGFTGEEFTCYYAKVLKNKVRSALDVLSDMVLHARLEQKDIEKEKQVIIEEIKMYWDLPSSYVHDLLNELIWANHPLGMHLAGTPETIQSLMAHQIRDYKQKFYHPPNFLISAVGSVSHEEIVQRCEKLFRPLGRGKLWTFKRANFKQLESRVLFRAKQTEQTHLCLGFRTLGCFHPDRFPLALLSIILGGNMSSRLFQEVREKQSLAYEIGSHVRQYQDTGAFVVNAGVENIKTQKAVKVILEQLQKICQTPLSLRELKKAKEFYRGQLLLGLEDTSEHMIWLGENILTMGKIVKPEELLLQIEKVSIQDVQRTAKKVFVKSKLSLAIIGPLTETQQREIRSFCRK